MSTTGPLTFELVTPDGVRFSEAVYEVMLPTPDGQIAVLPHHAELTSVASAGVVSVRRHESDADSTLEHFATNGGIIEVDGPVVRLLADSAEHAADIDAQHAAEALRRAQELRANADDHVALADAEALIEHNIARIKVAELQKRTRKKY